MLKLISKRRKDITNRPLCSKFYTWQRFQKGTKQDKVNLVEAEEEFIATEVVF